MLGIVIGVGAVVGMVSLGQGATASVQREIASLGTNVLIIIPGATTVGGVRGGLGTVSTLTIDDARDIEKRVENAIEKTDSLKDADIKVEVSNGVARLTGTVERPEQRMTAAVVAREAAGVKAVKEELRIASSK